MARSCATMDASNKDNVCKPTIPGGVNRPPPSETIFHVTRVPNHETRAEKKYARKKHKAARSRSRLEDLTFGTFNVRTAAVNGVNGIGQIDTLLRPCAAKSCDAIGLQETKGTGLPKSWHLDTASFQQ